MYEPIIHVYRQTLLLYPPFPLHFISTWIRSVHFCELDECLFSSVASFKALKSTTSLCYLGSELTSNISLLFSEAAGFPLSYSLVHRACRAAGLMQTHCVHVCDSKPKRLGGKKWLKYSSEAQACASSCLCTLCFKAAWYLRSLWKAWITLTKPKWPRFILSWPKGRVPNARN